MEKNKTNTTTGNKDNESEGKKNYEDRLTWKKGDVEIYESIEDFKKKNPNVKIIRP